MCRLIILNPNIEKNDFSTICLLIPATTDKSHGINQYKKIPMIPTSDTDFFFAKRMEWSDLIQSQRFGKF